MPVSILKQSINHMFPLLVTVLLALASPLLLAQSSDNSSGNVNLGFTTYQKYCASCHVLQGRPTVAPPLFAVKSHVISHYPERDAFVRFIMEWVINPNPDRATMRGAIHRFGLMPPIRHIPPKELTAVAEFLYTTDFSLPDWYKEHYREEHGVYPK